MAANRIESAPDPAGGKSEPTAAAPAPAGGFKAWLPLLATLVAMPVLAYAVTTFVLLPKLQKGLGITAPAAGESPGKEGGKEGGGQKEIFTLNKLLVNVNGTMGARYLIASFTLEGSGPDFKTKIQQREPKLKDMACGALMAKTMVDIEKPGIRNLVRSELISGFNGILGGPVVQEIYITEFAIQ